MEGIRMSRTNRTAVYLLTLLLIFVIPIQAFAADKPITINIDNEKVDFSVQPQYINGVVYVPIRTICEKLGIAYEWNNQTKTVSGVKGNKEFELKLGSSEVIYNGKARALHGQSFLQNGTMLVPLRFVAESIQNAVIWDGSTYTASITTDGVLKAQE
jgi:hypothetical protein